MSAALLDDRQTDRQPACLPACMLLLLLAGAEALIELSLYYQAAEAALLPISARLADTFSLNTCLTSTSSSIYLSPLSCGQPLARLGLRFSLLHPPRQPCPLSPSLPPPLSSSSILAHGGKAEKKEKKSRRDPVVFHNASSSLTHNTRIMSCITLKKRLFLLVSGTINSYRGSNAPHCSASTAM